MKIEILFFEIMCLLFYYLVFILEVNDLKEIVFYYFDKK